MPSLYQYLVHVKESRSLRDAIELLDVTADDRSALTTGVALKALAVVVVLLLAGPTLGAGCWASKANATAAFVGSSGG